MCVALGRPPLRLRGEPGDAGLASAARALSSAPSCVSRSAPRPWRPRPGSRADGLQAAGPQGTRPGRRDWQAWYPGPRCSLSMEAGSPVGTDMGPDPERRQVRAPACRHRAGVRFTGPCTQTQHSCHPAGGPQRPSWPGAAAERLASPGSRHVTGSRAAGHPLAGVARGPGRGRAGGDPASRQAPAPHCPSSRPHGGPSTTAERAGARSGATATEETSPARSDTLFSLLRLSPRESDGSAMPGDTPKAKELQTRRVPVRSLRSHCR